MLLQASTNFTTTVVQGGGNDWTFAIWKTNGSTATNLVSPIQGNTYKTIFNGTGIGNGLANTRIRNPVTSATTIEIFPGDSLTMDTNTEFRAKNITSGAIGTPTFNFPGTNSNPGLILNGGLLNGGDDATFVITGKVQVAGQSYISHGANGGGGGLSTGPRAFNFAGVLTGTNNLVILNAYTSIAQQISGASNTFSGQWIVQCGLLRGNSPGSGTNTLGTNSITVDPLYVGYKGAMPSATSPNGPAWFEANYDMNSAGVLTLTNGGIMVLHQNCIFSAIRIETNVLSAGTHTYAELSGNFPSNFALGGSGSLTVQPYGPPPGFPPSVTLQPTSFTGNLSSPGQLTSGASGGNIRYQWQKGTNAIFVNATDTGDVTGSTNSTLNFSGLLVSDGADYRLIATNNFGAATSQVATVTVFIPDTNRPVVTALSPVAGSTVSNLTQLQVTFSKNVTGVEAEDLLVNGAPATTLSGSGSNYLFTFTQPSAGTVLMYWDIESAISDLVGNTFDTSGSWTYTLIDNIAPTLASTSPPDGATVGTLTQAQVVFSEPVSGVTAPSLLINGSPATNVSASVDNTTYTFQFTQPAQGGVLFSWALSQNIRDLSALSNLFSPTGWSVTLDTPGVTSAYTNIVINEFLASNQNTNTGLRDEDFELNDWIELYNRGAATVSLAGWSLTDSADLPAQWRFPNVSISPGQYLIVFASGKDRTSPNLHTDFTLNISGEYLGLYGAEYPPQVVQEFAPSFPEQRNDISYGFDSTNALKYFATPTPGGPNGDSSITGTVSPIHFSVNHGYFNRPFNLYLTTTTPGPTIIYTTDGSVPSISGGVTNGTLYSGPININHTTPLRAAAFADGLLPTLTGSQSYFFVEDIILQPNTPAGYPTGNVWTPTPGTLATGARAYYQMDPAVVNDPQYTNAVRAGLLSIPTMSITVPISDLFDPANGIYTHPESRGVSWERACSIELVFPDGASGAQIDCGLQIQGGTQRQPGKNAKHSFRVNFKSDYSFSKFHFPIFPDSPVDTFNTFILDGGINLWWHYVNNVSGGPDQRYRAQCVRDQYTSDLMLALGWPSFHGKFYHVYLNGLYWGIHYIHERTDEDFAASYFGGSSTNYDVIKNTTDGINVVVAGDMAAWNTALSLANIGLTNNAQYEQLQQYVDVDNLIDYMIVNHWVGNNDWPQHNYYMIRQRNPASTFKFMIWDAEHVMDNLAQNSTTLNSSISPAQLYTALRNNAEFKLRYADHLQKLFFNGGLFYTDPNPANALWDPAHPERNIPAYYYMKRITEITNAIVDESARWGGYTLTNNGFPLALVNANIPGNNLYARNDYWLRELNNLLGYTNTAGNTANYFPNRSTTVLNQYKTLGLFPSVSAPVFNQTGGSVPVGFALTMTNQNAGGKIYYTTNGMDPRVYGSGAVLFGALTYSNGNPVVLNSSTTVKARVLSGSWSALTEGDFTVALLGIPIRITELMYNPVGGSTYEYLELQNIGTTDVDLSGYSFEGITYVFPNETLLAPGAVIVLANNTSPSLWAGRYPGVVVSGYYGGNLANGGERIALLDQFGNTVISVDYSNGGGWPTAADGGGFALEIVNSNGDPDDPANWRAGASPGIANVPANSSAVRFNEVMAENVGAVTNGPTTNSDWVEIYNGGVGTISVGNWSFSNSGNARKYVIPSGTNIAAGGYLVIWCDSATNAPGLHSGFNLGRKGENLFLYDSTTNRVDAFSFGLQLTNYTIGKIGTPSAWQLTTPTPGAVNVAASVGGATNLVINEWLANSTTGGTDWLELFNKSSNQPVALAGLYLGTSNDLFEVRSLSFVPPRGFVQLFADKNPGFDHLDFKLSAGGDGIVLYDYFGSQVDRVSFTNQIDGVSQGRLPDASANIVNFPGSASPTASNYIISYTGPRINELMALNNTAVYDTRGNNPDWFELYNPNGTNFSLAGMSFGTDPGSAGQWVVPAGVTVASNGYYVIWCNGSLPASTNGTTNLNTGFSLRSDGDVLYLFGTNSQVLDSVSFGHQIADMSIGKNAGTWALMSAPTPGAANAANATLGNPANLRINEWMTAPVSSEDWFELYNTDPLPVSLGGLYLTDDPSIAGTTNSHVAALSYIAGHGWAKYQADGHLSQGANHVSFSLDKNGETLRIYGSDFSLIDSVEFGLQVTGVSQGRLPDGGSNIVSFVTTPTPDASNYLPLQNVVVNEVLSHTDLPLEDAIELYNPSGSSVNIGGWFISNAETEFKKYRIPNGTTIAAGGYKVFYEYQFNISNAVPFSFNSAHGDHAYLSEADSLTNLTGYRAQVVYGAAANGVSFGRFPTSVGADFVAMANRTFGVDNPANVSQFRTGPGLTNSYAKVGPVVINEIMYHPITGPITNSTENTDEEFIELFNITSNSVPLYDPAATTNHWKLANAVDYVFPATVSLPAGGFLVVVGFDPATNATALTNFRTKYSVVTNVPIYGPYSGHLGNSSETIELYKPDPPQLAPHPDLGFVPYVLVESVTYSNAAPWSTNADGTGMSLQRALLGSYGNEPLNWVACIPSAGSRNCRSDADGDGLPDDWELANGLNPFSAAGANGASGDLDGDHFTNMQEYLAGTDPRNAASYLKITSIAPSGGFMGIFFTAVAGHTYTLQSRTNLNLGTWQKVSDIGPFSNTTPVQVLDTATGKSRFYRLTTPKLP